MRLKLIRQTFTEISATGSLFSDEKFLCYTLEDKDRALDDIMTVEEIQKIKVFGKTAIPYGSYEVVITYSDKFKMYLPQLLNVKDYDGIRIHAGNTDEDTEGCVLVGETKGTNFIGNSRAALNNVILPVIKTALQTEKLFIDIVRAN